MVYDYDGLDFQTSLPLNNKLIGSFRNSKSKQVQESVSITYFQKAMYYYKIGDNLSTCDNFINAFRLGNATAGSNLFYLLRKKEIIPTNLPYTMEELIEPGLNEKLSFALINKAMYSIEESSEWELADNLFSQIELTNETSDDIEDVKSWWLDLANSGDIEGDLVLAMLNRHNLINDPDELSIKDRLGKLTGWDIPNFLFEEINLTLEELQV